MARAGAGRTWRTACVFIIILHFFASESFAASQKSKPKPEIPKTPSAPIPLGRQIPVETFQCERFFTYKGKVLGCDSNVRTDGERLRPILEDLPSAVEQLNIYQSNRRKVRATAYTGSLGLLVMVTGMLLSKQYTDDNGNLTSQGRVIRNVAVFSGIGITAGSLIYGLTLLRTNEVHLQNAVNQHNNAHPESPIELQFSTGIVF